MELVWLDEEPGISPPPIDNCEEEAVWIVLDLNAVSFGNPLSPPPQPLSIAAAISNRNEMIFIIATLPKKRLEFTDWF
jgi:hypothetical protein